MCRLGVESDEMGRAGIEPATHGFSVPIKSRFYIASGVFAVVEGLHWTRRTRGAVVACEALLRPSILTMMKGDTRRPAVPLRDLPRDDHDVMATMTLDALATPRRASPT